MFTGCTSSKPNESNNEGTVVLDSKYQPDILNIRNKEYEDMPIFDNQYDTNTYVLYQLLNNNYDFEFYLTSDFVPDEGSGGVILNQAVESALTYYFFSAFDIYNMATEEPDEQNRVLAKITLIYAQKDYDLIAREEAIKYVEDHPVPIGGFKDFEEEKEYALAVHDFIAKKVIYSQIGFHPELMLGMDNYNSFEEAYCVLDKNSTEAVCAGYAKAFALICQYADINAIYMAGNEEEIQRHAWNMLFPCDGSEPVLIDVTWDDGYSNDVIGQKEVAQNYFYLDYKQDSEHIPFIYMLDYALFLNK